MDVKDVSHVILAGGKGTRLYPISSNDKPKQFLNLIPDFNGSMIQYSHKTFSKYFNHEYIISNTQYKNQMKQQKLNKNDIILYEPEQKGTGIQIQLLLGMIESLSTILIITPADHYYGNIEVLDDAIQQQIREQNETDNIILLGQKALKINTDYGWIQIDNNERKIEGQVEISKINNFVEKPDYNQQQEMFLSNNYYYNMGIFIQKQKNLLSIISSTDPTLYKLIIDLRFKQKQNLKTLYDKLDTVSFDKSVIQKTNKLLVITGNFDWLDLGLKENLMLINKDLVESSLS